MSCGCMLFFMRLRTLAVLTIAGATVLGALPEAQRRTETTAPVAGYRVVRVFPHDPQAFTQGLEFVDGVLHEGTGLNGRSSIRKVRLENGEVLQLQKVEDRYFGEGITVWRDSILELTWQSGIGFIYDRASLRRTGTFNYRGEGWGLTNDGSRLIMSDGTAVLRFLDPVTQKETGRLQVRDGGKPVARLNELEYVKGEILANVWETHRVARISPSTGLARVDRPRGLLSPRDEAQWSGRPQRHRLRRRRRSPVRDGQALAEALRDQDRPRDR